MATKLIMATFMTVAVTVLLVRCREAENVNKCALSCVSISDQDMSKITCVVPEQVANGSMLLGWDAQLRERNGVTATAAPKIVMFPIFFSLLVAPRKIHDASAHLGTQFPARQYKTLITATPSQRCCPSLT
jgi:hypothetical protein